MKTLKGKVKKELDKRYEDYTNKKKKSMVVKDNNADPIRN